MSQKVKILILVVLHIVGVFGFSLSFVQPLFIKIVPLHLFIVTFVLFSSPENFKPILPWFLFIASFIGLASEWLGVNYGLLFGNYSYSSGLGPALQGVPWVIGVLWAGLALASNDLVGFVVKKENVFINAFLAASIMCTFDYLLEPFAIKYGLWQWSGGVIPLYNYICWWLIGFVICLIYQMYFKSSKQIASLYYIGAQALFFIIVLLIN